ncbi:MAG: hypothetical protein V3R96_06185 [Dehalococcoidales bacterium]
MKVGKRRQMVARLAAAASALAVLLAIISRFTYATIVITQNSFMSFAIVAILFAIYFTFDGWVDANRKG